MIHYQQLLHQYTISKFEVKHNEVVKQCRVISSRFLYEVLDPSDYIVIRGDGKVKEETTRSYQSDDTKILQ